MDDKLAKTLSDPSFPAWRATLWREISNQAIGEGWAPKRELRRLKSFTSSEGGSSEANGKTSDAVSSAASSRAGSVAGSSHHGSATGGLGRGVLRRTGNLEQANTGRDRRGGILRSRPLVYLDNSDDEDEEDDEVVLDWECAKWESLYCRLVEIRYLFRPPVSRCVHARFLHNPKNHHKIDVGYLSFHTSPHPSVQDKGIFERRKAELLEWRAQGGMPPQGIPGAGRERSPKRS
ncbi:hypothetical protein K402DRAFT_405867 [Aulographum hederae CBS 113979]|uniref:Uncharacterized protein n=1 Tax=Aulographum hederae CBS 113979 TaxID=1176131 RepID=A0A6G1GVM3_9PEZI|nr:hypothetical protein K402DRAFT_405867 [Aulographum hederae CBS 113979]